MVLQILYHVLIIVDVGPDRYCEGIDEEDVLPDDSQVAYEYVSIVSAQLRDIYDLLHFFLIYYPCTSA